MKNPLKDIFSTNKPEYRGKLYFENEESSRAFFDALQIVHEVGETIELKGISNVESYIKFGDVMHKMPYKGELINFRIGPSKEEQTMEVETDFGKYVFLFRRYQTNSCYYLESNTNSIIYIKIRIEKESQDANFTCNINLNNAQTLQQLLQTFNAMQFLLQKLFGVQNKEINECINDFMMGQRLWKIMLELEKEFNTIFCPINFTTDPNVFKQDSKTIYKLYHLFIRKQMMKRTLKSLSLDGTDELKENMKLKESQPFTFLYIDEIKEKAFGCEFRFLTQNFIPFSVISKIESMTHGDIKYVLTGTDTKPLYLIYRAYQMDEEIPEVSVFNTINFEDAKTFSELMREL